MTIVIPMAGLSRRFADVGYAAPKYMLPLEGKTLFAHAVESFRAYFETHAFVFIAREVQDTVAFIDLELAKAGVRSSRTVVVPEPTLGQADSVRIGIEQSGISENEPLTIFNIDTFRPNYRFPQNPWFGRSDGYLEVIRSSLPMFSYVLPRDEAEGTVEGTAEKKVISNLASTGLYHFQRAGQFMAAFNGLKDEDGAERYVAPLYNHLIRAGADIRYELIASSDVIFCGTPDEYEKLGGVRANHA